ncbi:MAG: MAPEG family protein [Pseudomonadota bacterium]|nr:MAPEG family protein [Pseudomonadota bacterium]MEC7657323.1 MAPEG family protein [Pseudomonadota bacterium]MEC8371536.1 MAPEG family protein [Pseudomonadota bacterium]MEC8698070.1 MAPEG family protein [Pseudomonadota bacterium]MEC9182723.1 MAPEG family protein [Pseudomonadota bacterium]
MKRAHLNLVENLPAFAVIVLIAHVAGISNPTIVLGAMSSSGTVLSWPSVISAEPPGYVRSPTSSVLLV